MAFRTGVSCWLWIHPVFVPRIILTPHTGICLDQAGGSQKHWSWHDLSRHVHGPPFQPITATLNGHLTLKIVSQDQIHLWFTSHSHCIRFNVGARLKVSARRARSSLPEMSPLALGLLHGAQERIFR